MKTSEIKTGLKFKVTETGRIYEITRISNASVWYKDITREPVWRIAKTTFIDMVNSDGYELIKL